MSAYLAIPIGPTKLRSPRCTRRYRATRPTRTRIWLSPVLRPAARRRPRRKLGRGAARSHGLSRQVLPSPAPRSHAPLVDLAVADRRLTLALLSYSDSLRVYANGQGQRETIGQRRICWARTAGVCALPVWFDATRCPRRATRCSCSAAKAPSRPLLWPVQLDAATPPARATNPPSKSLWRDTSHRQLRPRQDHHSVADRQAAPPAPRRRPSRAAPHRPGSPTPRAVERLPRPRSSRTPGHRIRANPTRPPPHFRLRSPTRSDADTHREPHTVAREIETAVTIGTDRPGPDVLIRRRWPTDDVAVEPGNLSGVQQPINDQLSRSSHGRQPYVRALTQGLSRAACSVPTDRAATAFEEPPLRCAI